MSQQPEIDNTRLEELRESLREISGQNQEPLRSVFGSFGDQELDGQVIYQNPAESVTVKQESASELGRLIVYWDLKEPQKAQKYGHMPADYLLVWPIRKEEVDEDVLHPLLNGMKGRMHYVCAQKLGFNHGVIFTPACYYPGIEALVVRVDPEESVVTTNSSL